jgi:hypothetical protein
MVNLLPIFEKKNVCVCENNFSDLFIREREREIKKERLEWSLGNGAKSNMDKLKTLTSSFHSKVI